MDTGSGVSIVSYETFLKIFPGNGRPVIKPSRTNITGYGHKRIILRGECQVKVQIQGVSKSLSLLISTVPNSPSLLGRNWMRSFNTRFFQNALGSHLESTPSKTRPSLVGGARVEVRAYNNSVPWVAATISRRLYGAYYLCRTSDGGLVRRHATAIRVGYAQPSRSTGQYHP